MKAYRGSWRAAALILNLDIRWKWVVAIMLRPFYPWEAPQYLLNRRLAGPDSWSKHFGEEKYLLLLPGIKVKIKYRQNCLQEQCPCKGWFKRWTKERQHMPRKHWHPTTKLNGYIFLQTVTLHVFSLKILIRSHYKYS